MLLEFGAQNFYSFKEGFELSLRLNKKCPENISRGKSNTNVICVKGANASGKTNVLKVLSFLHEFTTESFLLKPTDKIPLVSFFDNSEPSEFYIIFEKDNIEYRYELSATKEKILSEVLYKKDSRETRIVERTENKLVYTTSDYSELKSMKLRSNASLISTANQYEIESINIFYKFFSTIITNVYKWGIYDIQPDIDAISKLYHEDKELFTFVKNQIKECDTGISDIKIFTRDDENRNKVYFPVFYHDLDEKIESTNIYSESSGTLALYKILFLYKTALSNGSLLVLDEFDINLHPLILPKLVRLFDNETNTKNAQLVFTTHNTAIMDELGKYRVVLVNKEKNCSYTYRLDELPGDIVRNDRSISKVYSLGKIGGIPKL